MVAVPASDVSALLATSVLATWVVPKRGRALASTLPDALSGRALTAGEVPNANAWPANVNDCRLGPAPHTAGAISGAVASTRPQRSGTKRPMLTGAGDWIARSAC